MTEEESTHLSLLLMLAKAGRFLSSRSAWDSASLDPGVVGNPT